MLGRVLHVPRLRNTWDYVGIQQVRDACSARASKTADEVFDLTATTRSTKRTDGVKQLAATKRGGETESTNSNAVKRRSGGQPWRREGGEVIEQRIRTERAR